MEVTLPSLFFQPCIFNTEPNDKPHFYKCVTKLKKKIP
jgi:hypothetical protein